MLSLDQSTAPYLFVALALAVVLVGAAVVYVVEIRRAGSTPWSEMYHDRVVPLYRARRRRPIRE